MHALCTAQGDPPVIIFQSACPASLCSQALFFRAFAYLLKQWPETTKQPHKQNASGETKQK